MLACLAALGVKIEQMNLREKGNSAPRFTLTG
jgi:hypothetical protein